MSNVVHVSQSQAAVEEAHSLTRGAMNLDCFLGIQTLHELSIVVAIWESQCHSYHRSNCSHSGLENCIIDL